MSGRSVARNTAMSLCVAVVTGLSAVAVLTDPGIVIAVLPLVVGAVVGIIGRYSVDSVDSLANGPGAARLPLDGAASAAIIAAAGTLGAALAVAGLVEITGPAAWSILQALALGAVARWWLRPQVAATGWSPGRGWTGRAPPPSTRSTAQLCRHWRSSFLRLREPIDPGELARILTARRELLAELERRDPAGFARFLASRNPAGADPRRYFHPPPIHCLAGGLVA